MLMKTHLEKQSGGGGKYLDDFTVQPCWLEEMASWTAYHHCTGGEGSLVMMMMMMMIAEELLRLELWETFSKVDPRI